MNEKQLMNPTRTTYPSYGGHFKTKKEAEKHAKLRRRYGYAVKIVPRVTEYEGKKYRGYDLRESQRPARHTWWAEHLPAEGTKEYLARMKRKGIKASVRNPIKKKFPLLGLALIGGLVYWIWRTNKQA